MKMNFSNVKFVTDVINQSNVTVFRRGEEFDSASIDYTTGQLIASRQDRSAEHIFPIGILEDPAHTIFICKEIR